MSSKDFKNIYKSWPRPSELTRAGFCCMNKDFTSFSCYIVFTWLLKESLTCIVFQINRSYHQLIKTIFLSPTSLLYNNHESSFRCIEFVIIWSGVCLSPSLTLRELLHVLRHLRARHLSVLTHRKIALLPESNNQ